MKTFGFCKFVISAGIARFVLILSSAYDLLVIEDEATPLAAGANHMNYYIVTISVMIVAVVFGLISAWTAKRNAVAKRLKELNEKCGEESKIPFTIHGIKEQIAEAEVKLVATMM